MSAAISVCVPYWNRQPALDAMFETYARLYPDLDLEIVVADDGSPVPARIPETNLRYALVRLPAKDRPLNPCVPINAAVAAASGETIVLTNPEIVHRAPALPALLSRIETDDDYVIAPCFDLSSGVPIAGEGVRYEEAARAPVPEGGHFHFLAALRRSLWRRAGGFDEEYRFGHACDDNDWLWRLDAAGARFRLSAVAVYHNAGERLRWELPHNRGLLEEKWGHRWSKV